MESGILIGFHNCADSRSDADVYSGTLEFCDLVGPAGFDFLMAAEHHFHPYSMCPDNIDFLSYMAARTTTLKLGTAAVIVPWNNPYRVAAKMSMLDHFSNKRAMLGLGRGLSPLEMELFDVDRNKTRGQYDEGSRMIINGLKTGFVEGNGPHFPQKRAPIRPAPLSTAEEWQNKLYCVGMTPTSGLEAAKLGGRLMSFAVNPWPVYKETMLDPYLKLYEEIHGKKAPPVVLGMLLVVDQDEGKAYDLAHKHTIDYTNFAAGFYQTGDHMKEIKGYEAYAEAGERLKNFTMDELKEYVLDLNIHGTPKQVIEKLRKIREYLGHPVDFSFMVDGGGIPYENSANSIRLYGENVIPTVKSWN
jgi:alkanesulfonate monooxygenase SsuD/methylene tetrahydromethanopterin reductase-like flavin-dependent oxidoreductase (luciferase family)